MSVIPISLVVEDPLSESVVRAILTAVNRGYAVGSVYGKGGFGYLRKNAYRFNQAARGTPYVMLTDLDNAPCAPGLIKNWMGVQTGHPNFILRIAVREVEAWLLADGVNLADFLGVSPKLLPKENVEQLVNPKKTLVDLAARSKSLEIRQRVVPKRGSTAKQGPDYNACLDRFIHCGWDVRKACTCSNSLERAVRCLEKFEPVWRVDISGSGEGEKSAHLIECVCPKPT